MSDRAVFDCMLTILDPSAFLREFSPKVPENPPPGET